MAERLHDIVTKQKMEFWNPSVLQVAAAQQHLWHLWGFFLGIFCQRVSSFPTLHLYKTI